MRKKLPAEGYTRRNVKGRKVQGRTRYQKIDNIKINGLYAETKRKRGKSGEYYKNMNEWLT